MLEARINHKTLVSGERLLGAISLHFVPGEITVLLGASGTGKTSLLRILLGLDADFSGQITRRTSRLGAQFQEPRLLPWLSVADNLRLVCPHADIDAALHAMDLGDIGASFPRQISLGMARRVALARALLVKPELLVLDEPFASLDPRTTHLVAAQITAHVRNHHAAVVVAMHDLDLATTFANRLIVLADRPAQVAADITIPAALTPATRRAMCVDLEQRFGFLGRKIAIKNHPAP